MATKKKAAKKKSTKKTAAKKQPAKAKAKAKKPKTYTAAKKKEVLAYIKAFNKKNKKGGLAAASRKFKIAHSTIQGW